MKSSVLKAASSAPVTVTWELNRKCNLSCAHCLSASGQGAETSLAAAKRAIDEFASLAVFQVNIGGGEPLLHPDIFSILEHCIDRNLVTCLSTNGTLMTPDKAKHLAELGVRIQVSLDGATELSNDAVRGEGTFTRILRGLEMLSRNQIRLAVNVVLTRLNFAELDAMLRVAQEFGAELRVSRLRPSGRAEDSWNELHPSREQLLSLKGWLGRNRDVLTGDSFFFLKAQGRNPDALDGCGAGTLTCCISPEGNVYPCAFLQSEPFLAGNLGEASFATIWREAPALTSIRTRLSTCAGCDRRDSCSGGCPAVSFGVKGSAAAPDPECTVLNRNEAV